MPLGAVVGSAQPVGVTAGGPAGAVTRPDRQRPELVERETPVREPSGDQFDAVQLGLKIRVVGLLPGAGALEADTAGVQDLPQPFPPDAHPARRCPPWVGAGVPTGQVCGQLAQTPVGERQPQLSRASGGRRDNDPGVSVGDPAGTTARPARAQAGQPTVLNAWITSRTVSSSAATRRAIAGTVVPDAEAMMINARRTRIDSCLPRRTRRNRYCPRLG
jgi:hypothetical protein